MTPAPEFTLSTVANSPTLFIVDIGASSIDINFAPPAGIEGVIFVEPGTVLSLGSLDDAAGDIVGITNFATANTVGVTASDVSFTAHSINFTFDSSEFDLGGTVSFDLLIRPSQVMEPTTLALLGIGLAGLGVRRRKRPAY